MMDWTHDFFINKGQLWLMVMKDRWQYGKRDANWVAKILKKFDLHRGKVLELGCGNGRVCIPLAKKGYEVTGVDISPMYIEDARKMAKRNKVIARFLVGDIREIDKLLEGEQFDAIISIWTTIGYYDKATDEEIFTKVSQLCKKGGLLMVLATQSKEKLSKIFWPTYYEETQQFVILHQAKFDHIRSIHEDRWLFYRKEGRDLKFVDALELKLRIYSQQELIDMVERVGFELIEAYDKLWGLTPVTPESGINMVFRKVRG